MLLPETSSTGKSWKVNRLGETFLAYFLILAPENINKSWIKIERLQKLTARIFICEFSVVGTVQNRNIQMESLIKNFMTNCQQVTFG